MQYSIGLDVDKVSFKACLKVKEGTNRSAVKATRTFAIKTQGFEEFNTWVKKHRKSLEVPLSIVMEATGVYHEHLAWYLHNHSYTVHIIVPHRAKHYMRSLGQKSKTDRIDAAGLADMGMQQELECWIPCSPELLMLRSLTRQSEMLQETKTSLNNQLHSAEFLAHCDPMVIENFQSLLKTITTDIDKLKTRISQLVKEDPILGQKYKLVGDIKGLGLLTFATIIAETGGFELFNSQKQLVSYSGYDVIESQSGTIRGKTRISKQGNRHIRRILHMASLNLVRYKVEPFCSLYDRVFDRSKIKMKGYVAVQRKLLCMIYSLWKKDEVFDPNYRTKETLDNPIEPKTKIAAEAAATLDRHLETQVSSLMEQK